MQISVFTFTRDRLAYTKECFKSLDACQEYQRFDQYILDNGSLDGTRDYLKTIQHKFKGVVVSPVNLGLHKACSIMHDLITPCDLVIKVDNDCLFKDPKIIYHIAKAYILLRKKTKDNYVVSPNVEGIVNKPKTNPSFTVTDNADVYTIRTAGQIGGICMAMPYALFKLLNFNTNLPMAKGLDSSICQQAVLQGYKLAYFDRNVYHMDTTNGQAKKYPSYFVRKKQEEKQPWGLN